MSAWAHSVDPSAWRYDQASQGTQPMQQTYVPQPSTPNGGQSINNSFDQWGSTSGYGQQGNSMGHVQTGYGGQGGGDSDYRVMNGPASSNHLHHPPSNPQLSHQSYASSSYPSTQQQSYPSTSRAPYQPPASQSHVEPPNSFRFGQHSEELPMTGQAAVSLSATAQRFQNAPSTGPPLHAPSPRFSQPIPQSSNIPIHQQPDSHSRPIPSPTSIQQFHRKVDELAMLQHRLTQLEGILKRGTMAETGPGASQPIPSNQQAHLDIQVKEFKNRQVNLMNECDAFTNHFGPASSWNGAAARLHNPNQSRIVANGQQPHQATNGTHNRQYSQEQQNGGGTQYSQISQQQVARNTSYPQSYSNPSDPYSSRHHSEHALRPVPANQYQPSYEANSAWNDPSSAASSSSNSAHGSSTSFHPPPSDQSYPTYNPASQPHPSPAYTHLPNPPPSNQQQTRPPSKPPHPSLNSANYPSYPSAQLTQQQHQQQLQQHQYSQQQFSNAVPSTSSHVQPQPSTSAPRQELPPGLRAQMDALTRDQAAQNVQGRGKGLGGANAQNPLQALIKKAENGEMPIMTMSGLRKPAEVEAEKKAEEAREKARNNARAEGENGKTNGNVETQSRKDPKQRWPTSMLADLCRQGGGATLAEMVMTIDTQVFWSQLQQICSKRGIQIFEEIHQGNFVVDNKPVDLLQLFQTVVSRGGGYGKIDAGNAWAHVATLLSISSRSSAAHARIKEIYHRILSPFEDTWATQMIKLREKQRAMEEARRVLGAGTTGPSSAASSPSNGISRPPSNVYQSSPQSQPIPVPSPLSGHSYLAPTNQTQTQIQSPQPIRDPLPTKSSMFANPTSYAPLPIPSPSQTASSPLARPPLAQTTENPHAQQQLPPRPQEKVVTSADLLEQARALRKNADATAAASNGSQVQQPSTTSPPQETSSTPQETAPAPAPSATVAAPIAKPATPASNGSSLPDPVQSAAAAAGHVAPFSTSAGQIGLGLPASVPSDPKRSVTNSRKRKNVDSDEGETGKTKTRNRSTSNLEAPVVGQQTNEPHFNPFEIAQFLPFSTSTTAHILSTSPSTAKSQPLFSTANGSAKSSLSAPSLRPDTSSTSGETFSPHSNGNGQQLPSTARKDTLETQQTSGTSASSAFVTPGTFEASPSFSTINPKPPTSAALDPSSFDSISLSMSLDPQATSRPSTSWAYNDTAIANGLSSFDTFGLDGFDFSSSTFGDDLNGIDTQSHNQKSNGTGLPNWSPQGLDGFDFGNTF